MTNRSTTSVFRTAGFWMALIMGLSQTVSAVRAFSDPLGFADYMGLALFGSGDTGFIYVYGLRTAFIAILVFLLAALKRLDALSWMALVAILMPVGDAILAAGAGAPSAIVIRHAAIAVFVGLTFIMLRRAIRGTQESAIHA